MLGGTTFIVREPALGPWFAGIFISLQAPLYTGAMPVRLIML
jgi:hypothetical protein